MEIVHEHMAKMCIGTIFDFANCTMVPTSTIPLHRAKQTLLEHRERGHEHYFDTNIKVMNTILTPVLGYRP